MRVAWFALFTVVAADLVAAPVTVAAEPAATELADGRYWVRRVVRDESRGSDGFGADGPGEVWVNQRTECQQLDLATPDTRRTLQLGDLTFTVRTDPTGWTLHTPTLTHRTPPLVLSGMCQATFAPAAAPIFRDRATCLAVPATISRRCKGATCRYDGEAPFLLPACEAVMKSLVVEAEPITGASHAESVKSFERFTRINRRGGRLWVDEPEAGRCQPLTVTPRRGGKVHLSQSFAIPDGGRVIYAADVGFEPLFQQAAYDSEGRSHEGGIGGGASGLGPFSVGLYLGRDVVLVGQRWMYFDRKSCEARRAATAE